MGRLSRRDGRARVTLDASLPWLPCFAWLALDDVLERGKRHLAVIDTPLVQRVGVVLLAVLLVVAMLLVVARLFAGRATKLDLGALLFAAVFFAVPAAAAAYGSFFEAGAIEAMEDTRAVSMVERLDRAAREDGRADARLRDARLAFRLSGLRLLYRDAQGAEIVYAPTAEDQRRWDATQKSQDAEARLVPTLDGQRGQLAWIASADVVVFATVLFPGTVALGVRARRRRSAP